MSLPYMILQGCTTEDRLERLQGHIMHTAETSAYPVNQEVFLPASDNLAGNKRQATTTSRAADIPFWLPLSLSRYIPTVQKRTALSPHNPTKSAHSHCQHTSSPLIKCKYPCQSRPSAIVQPTIGQTTVCKAFQFREPAAGRPSRSRGRVGACMQPAVGRPRLLYDVPAYCTALSCSTLCPSVFHISGGCAVQGEPLVWRLELGPGLGLGLGWGRGRKWGLCNAKRFP